MVTEQPKPFQRSVAAELLITLLKDTTDHRVISYGELAELAHCDVQHKERHALDTARRHAWRRLNKYFIVVVDVGIKLATDEEISSLGIGAIRHVRRTARMTREKMSLANLDKLSNRQRLEHMAATAILGLHEQSGRGIVQKRIEAAMEHTGPKVLEAEELLKISGVKQIT